ncbi:hypothetical protein [Streptomyces sp. NPDC048295]|uniref:hypothetical protein n=1 Tax=Streptomyces sp. NPDC048295 TaxID=3154617 RepID=UPI0034386BFB
MSALPTLLTDATATTAAVTLVHATAVAAAAVASVLSRDPDRRRDARTTLSILLGRRGSR